MGNKLNSDNFFLTEQQFEISEVTEKVTFKEIVIALWNKGKALISGTKNAVSDVLLQDQNSDTIIDKEKKLTITEDEFRRWEAQPHFELPIIDDKTVEVAFRPELPKKGEPFSI